MKKARVLVAEDEAITARDLQLRLQNMGYDVPYIVAKGGDAIEKARDIRPDLLLMDIMLADEIDGIEAARQIRLMYDVPVIYLSAYTDKMLSERAKDTEPFGYLSKPFADSDLHNTIEMALFKHSAVKKLRHEKEVKAAREWDATFNAITDMVSIHDKDFRIVRVNKAFSDAFNKKSEELIGKKCYTILHGSDEPHPKCPHKRTMDTKKPTVEEFFEPQLGKYLQVSTSPIFDENGEVTGSIHIAKEITDRISPTS